MRSLILITIFAEAVAFSPSHLAPQLLKPSALRAQPHPSTLGAQPHALPAPRPAAIHRRQGAGSLRAASSGLKGFFSEPDPPPQKILDAVESSGGRVTVGDVASSAGVPMSESKKQLTTLAQLTQGDLEVSTEGELVYVFDKDFKAALSARSAKRRLQETWAKIAPAAFYVLRVSFGVALITSIAVVFTAILVLQSSNRDDRDDRRGGYGYSPGGFYYGPSFWWGPSPFDFLWYNPYQPYGVNRYEEPGEMSFLESVFSFLFGDGDPNSRLEERRARAVAQLVRENGGAVVAEQLAPFMDPPLQYGEEGGMEDGGESFVLPAITELGGSPEVTEDGEIVYIFDDLQVSAAGTGGLPQLPTMSVSELQKLAKQEGISTRGLFEKEELVSGIQAVLQARQEVAATDALSKGSSEGSFLQEQEYKFSLASSGQLLGVGILGFLNLAGAAYLGNLFASPYIAGKTLVGFLGAVKAIYPFLLAYGVAFLAVPLVRYFKIQADNAAIEERNRKRASWAFALKRGLGGDALQQKLQRAKERRQKLKIVGKDDVDYTTGKSIEEQGLDLKQWDKQFEAKKED